MPHLIENEKTKLLASALDRVSTGVFLVGIVGPFAAIIYKTAPSLGDDALLLSIFCWFTGGVIIHKGAQKVLETLRE